MKKTIISIAVAAAAVFTGSAFAQNPTNTAATKSTKECTEQCAQKKDKQASAFEGLNLNAKQQEQLKDLQEQTQKAKQDAGEKAKADKQKQNADRKAAKQTARKEYLAKVKAILTPEQYVQFLENNYVNAAPQMKGDRKGGKDMKQGNRKGQKGDRKGGKQGGRPQQGTAPKADKK